MRNADPSVDGREAEVSDGRKGTKRPEPGELADLGRRFRGHGAGNPIPALPYAKTRDAPGTKDAPHSPISLGHL